MGWYCFSKIDSIYTSLPSICKSKPQSVCVLAGVQWKSQGYEGRCSGHHWCWGCICSRNTITTSCWSLFASGTSSRMQMLYSTFFKLLIKHIIIYCYMLHHPAHWESNIIILNHYEIETHKNGYTKVSMGKPYLHTDDCLYHCRKT